MKKECAHCGESFKVKANNARFCSIACGRKHHNDNLKSKTHGLYDDLKLFKSGKLPWNVLKKRIGKNALIMKRIRSRLAFEI